MVCKYTEPAGGQDHCAQRAVQNRVGSAPNGVRDREGEDAAPWLGGVPI